MMGTATQPLDTAAVPLGGPASAAREVQGPPGLARVAPHCRLGSTAPPGSVAACDSGHWGPDCSHPCNCSAGRGSCDAASGRCLCEAGYMGPQCEQGESHTPSGYGPCGYLSWWCLHVTRYTHLPSCAPSSMPRAHPGKQLRGRACPTKLGPGWGEGGPWTECVPQGRVEGPGQSQFLKVTSGALRPCSWGLWARRGSL